MASWHPAQFSESRPPTRPPEATPGTAHSPIGVLKRPHTERLRVKSCKPDMSASDLGEGLFNGISIRHPVVRPPAAARRVRLLDQPEARREAEPRSPLGPARSLGHFLEDPGAGRVVLIRPFVAAVLGSSASSFDLGTDVLDGGLLLARLPEGTLGEESARLLGSFVVAKVWQTVTARARAGQHARVDAALYLDEAQNFLTLQGSIADMLAEARGYRLSLVAAHQHLSQLPRELRDAISANARNKVIFNCSPEDARALERHVSPELTEHDLSHLGAHQVAARLVVDFE